MKQDEAKSAAGRKAADLIQNGQIVGLGTGSTAFYFIEALAKRCQNGLKIKAIPSSRSSAEQAKRGGMELIDFNLAPKVDITVDGADEIDPQKRMIKGRGGAHVREKILAASSREMVVIIDESKQVPVLGQGCLPIEVLFYGSPSTRARIENLGHRGKWRLNADATLFVTENGNLLFDAIFESPPEDPEATHEELIHLPGVVDTGFFFGLAGRVIIGRPDGTSKILE